MIPARLERSQLFVPAHRWRMIEKAVISPADVVVLGFDGKQCIHPGQLNQVNVAFTHTPHEVAHAQAVVAALHEAEAKGRGAASLEGRMVDAANIRMAQVTLRRHAQERRTP